MSDPVAHFQTATRKGGRQLTIDDETFTLKRATLASADLLATQRATLATDDMTVERIMGMLQPFVRADEWDRFHTLVLDMEAEDLSRLFAVIAGQAVKGVDPTEPVSSQPGSSSTGGDSPDGASVEGSPALSV
jgi:hypothetical protein